MRKIAHIGGSFAPPLTAEMLDQYESLLPATGPIRDAMQTLLKCVRHWWTLPESVDSVPTPHPSGRGAMVPLDDPVKTALWDDIPWEHEIEAIQRLIDRIDPATQRDLRNAAFHLLWHVKELNADREPITTDKL